MVALDADAIEHADELDVERTEKSLTPIENRDRAGDRRTSSGLSSREQFEHLSYRRGRRVDERLLSEYNVREPAAVCNESTGEVALSRQ
ncbi:hypothetical protein C8039_07590 [Halogeometricum sp. wsp3]|nr:hypothetical protein C8039_07590 [Halogeometricum sp. wsp3]